MFDELMKCKDLMVRFGGHAMAAGFTYKGSIEEIEKKLDKDLNEII